MANYSSNYGSFHYYCLDFVIRISHDCYITSSNLPFLTLNFNPNQTQLLLLYSTLCFYSTLLSATTLLYSARKPFTPSASHNITKNKFNCNPTILPLFCKLLHEILSFPPSTLTPTKPNPWVVYLPYSMLLLHFRP